MMSRIRVASESSVVLQSLIQGLIVSLILHRLKSVRLVVTLRKGAETINKRSPLYKTLPSRIDWVLVLLDPRPGTKIE